MKKFSNTGIYAVLLAGVLIAGALSGCGLSDKSVTDTEGAAGGSIDDAGVVEFNAADYVTLGDYKGVNVTIDGDYSTDEAALDEYIDSVIAQAGGYDKDPDATEVTADSIVNVDYTGIKDGEAFDGGSATDVTIDVAGNSDAVSGGGYIDGFTDGLVGAKVGDTIDCDVTFPEVYQSSELAGQQVIFRFKINYICKKVTREDLTDDFVKENFGYDTVDDFVSAMREAMVAEKEENRTADIRSAVVSTVVANSTVNSYPEDEMSIRGNEYIDSFMQAYGVDEDGLSDYLESTFQVTEDEFKDEIRLQSEDNISTELIFLAIAEKEGITLDEEGYEAYVNGMLLSYGFSDENTLYESYASNAARGEKYISRIYLCNKAIDFCVENANVTETIAD